MITRLYKNGAVLLACMGLWIAVNAKDGQIRLLTDGTNNWVQVMGGRNDDWRIQISKDLVTWSNLASFGALLSNPTNGPSRSVGNFSNDLRFY